MDSEEIQELAHLKHSGKSLTDKGPYFYATKWGSYKGARRGELGGSLIGMGVGTLVGIAAAAITVVATGALSLPVVLPIVLGCAAGGTLLGIHEFANIGTVSGAVSSAHNLAEKRIKEFEQSKFAKLEAKVDALAQAVTGKKTADLDPSVQAAGKADAALAEYHENGYPTRHCDESHCKPEDRRLYFPFVGLVGAVVGLAVGAVMGYAGLADHLLHALGEGGHILGHTGVVAGTMTVTGLFGASFGINRDLFRQVFDITDPLFEGRMPGKTTEKSTEIEIHPIEPQRAAPSPQVNVQCQTPCSSRVVVSGGQQMLYQEHLFRDKEIARRMLLELDPATTRTQ